jgi:hypothetical protein
LGIGESGKISVDFDPSSAAGFFSKLVLVKGNQGQVQDSLYIEGIALPYPTNLERNYPVKLGFLGLRMKKVSMGDVFDNEPKVKYLEFFNYGTKALEKQVFHANTPAYIQIQQVQDLVRPQERGLLKISYEAKQRPELGAVSDKIWINWSKEEEGKMELEVLADLFDYFSPISKERLEEVPQLLMSQKIIQLGEISCGDGRAGNRAGLCAGNVSGDITQTDGVKPKLVISCLASWIVRQERAVVGCGVGVWLRKVVVLGLRDERSGLIGCTELHGGNVGVFHPHNTRGALELTPVVGIRAFFAQ